jgi:hypothetical protein
LVPLSVEGPGVLGRLHAQRLAGTGLEPDPERWGIESTLYSALHLRDAAGAITLGTAPDVIRHQRLPLAGTRLADALDVLAQDVAATLPAGSSAGGEQLKFLAVLENGQHVLVKFTPPRGTPYGERWHDLLHAEQTASDVLSRHGVAVARAAVVESARRTYLLSERFDRIGEHGRRHVVAIADAHRAFLADSYSGWAASVAALARQGRLPPLDAERAAALMDFGRLIGNTDMHAGNLGLLVRLEDLRAGRFSLAPVYDMLPMRWRPNHALGEAPDYAAFEIAPALINAAAAIPARDFWQAISRHSAISPRLRAVGRQMARAFEG